MQWNSIIMPERCTPFTKPLIGTQKPIMGGKHVYTADEWFGLNTKFNALRESLTMGTRDAVVSVVQFLCALDYRIPYANYEYQQRYDKRYAVYPYIGLNPQWGERFKRKGGWLPPQGLYCSALVEWAMINAGIDFGDRVTTDARTYRGVVMKTAKAFADGLIKPGDTVHTSQRKSATGRIYNHIGIVLAVLPDGLLVAEERPLRGLIVTHSGAVSKAGVKFARLDTVVIGSNLYRM